MIQKSDMCLPVPIVNNIVQGLCHTDQWKRSLSILNETVENLPNGRNIVAKKAFCEGEIDLGFQLLDEIILGGREIDPNACDAYWEFCRQHGERVVENVERMLRFLESKEVMLTKSCTQNLHHVITDFGFSGDFVSVNQRYSS